MCQYGCGGHTDSSGGGASWGPALTRVFPVSMAWASELTCLGVDSNNAQVRGGASHAGLAPTGIATGWAKRA